MTLPSENVEVKLSPARAVESQGHAARWWLFAFSVLLFVFSLLLVKEGARPLGAAIRSLVRVESPWSALGFGWLLATLILSGSPVAAAALAFLDAGLLSVQETFLMVAGSRLGAAMIVLLIGFAYTLRGRQRESSLGAGLISLLVTQTIYVPTLAIGYLLLSRGWFANWDLAAMAGVVSPLDRITAPLVALIASVVPVGGLFSVGFVLMLLSFWLFDRSLPTFGLRQSNLGRVNRLLYRPIVSFAMGAALTALTMSVSVSLGLLVPLSARGYIRQENAIPYIMGANITTFIDTLIAAALLANPAAVAVVLVQMISVALVSCAILVAGFSAYERLLSALATRIAERRELLAVYLAGTMLIPVGLLLLP